jgi:UDP:flavonoid glycosyltransferase YjiC (YdhE family)
MNLTLLLTILVFLACYVSFAKLSKQATAADAEGRAARLKRIANASRVMQILLGFGIAVYVYTLVAFWLRWSFFGEPHIRIFVSEHHIYTSLKDMPNEVLAWWLVKNSWAIVCYGVLFALFNLYRRGILFSAQNVRLIRALGYYLIVDWWIDYSLQGAVRDTQLSTTSLFIGFIVIFVSWIMDEGRKISEEQELTV